MKNVKSISLALQGGGSHGAFTWGVLETFLRDERLKIEGISGTSAGAMNAAVLADGITRDGREGALAALERFWRSIAKMGRFGPFTRSPMDALFSQWNLEHTPGYALFDTVSRYLSPYQFNPLNFNPLMDLLEREVDFERVRQCDKIKLFIAATSVNSGRIRVFHNEELSAKAVMASACLPHLFQAIEIDGECYWDGGYMGNPAIFPLIYDCKCRDVIIVQVNAIARDTTPTTSPEILDRLNEITFNSTLLRELRAIDFVSKLLDRHELDESKYKRMLIHRVDAAEEMLHLNVSSKVNAEWQFIDYLRRLGNAQAEAWLAENFDALGERSTIDLVPMVEQ